MNPTSIRRAASVAKSIVKLLPKDLPPALTPKKGNLYQILSRTPNSEAVEVHQHRWSKAGASDSYWKVTQSRFKCEGMHGKAWGILYWKGQKMSKRPQLIRGALKFTWAEGRAMGPRSPVSPSQSKPTPAKSPKSPTQPTSLPKQKAKAKTAA